MNNGQKLLTIWESDCILMLAGRGEGGQVENARVAELVTRDLAKVETAGSSPVYRSCGGRRSQVDAADFFFFCLGV